MKASKATVQQRVEQVLKIRLLGAQFHDVREYAQANDPETGRPWNVSDGQLWRYIKASDDLLAETLEHNREKLLNRHVAQRHTLYARAMEAGDWRAALAVLDSEGKLLDLFPTKKLELGGKDGSPITLHIVEEIVGHTPGTPLEVQEEVVTSDHGSSTAGAIQEGQASPGPASLSQE
jgi:hypothetical protein